MSWCGTPRMCIHFQFRPHPLNNINEFQLNAHLIPTIANKLQLGLVSENFENNACIQYLMNRFCKLHWIILGLFFWHLNLFSIVGFGVVPVIMIIFYLLWGAFSCHLVCLSVHMKQVILRMIALKTFAVQALCPLNIWKKIFKIILSWWQYYISWQLFNFMYYLGVLLLF